MKRCHLLILCLLFSSPVMAQKVIDLGDLSIEGEVRRPLMVTLQSSSVIENLARHSARQSARELKSKLSQNTHSQEYQSVKNQHQSLLQSIYQRPEGTP